MSLLKRISYQIKKYKLRKLTLPPVDTIIFSENSSDHWPFLNVVGMNVLDLGIGRWSTTDINEASPIYFKHKTANKIIGVDSDKNEVEFFRNYFTEHFRDKSIFINAYINTPKELFLLISENNINSIKCDIEGAEINLFKLKLQEFPNLHHVAIEYHSPLLLKQLVNSNNNEWKFKIINHSIFSRHSNMGVVTLSR
jgi:hypothetical protein